MTPRFFPVSFFFVLALLLSPLSSGWLAAQTCLDITKQANMGFMDDVEGDRKGGWTDQGKVNDLRSLPVGEQTMASVKFRILDPDANDGKSCLVLAGSERPYFPHQIDIPVEGQTLPYLYLLHATAWTPRSETPIGALEMTYADGSNQKIDVVALRDVSNWWMPFPLPNGAIGWTADNRSAYVGLYVSKFRLQDRPLQSIRLTSNNKAVWMVVAMTGSREDIALPDASAAPFYIVEGDDWKPIENLKLVQPGSALDFSFLTDAPAGKYGRLIARNGRFEFTDRPGHRVRLFGVNLCYDLCFPSHEDAELLAETLQRMGYNAVRFEHYDFPLPAESRDNPSARPTLNPDRLDRMEYLIACLKKHGLYITLDLHSLRNFPAEACPEFGQPFEKEIGGLVHFSPKAMEAWRYWAKILLTHRNPYTNLSLVEDPVLVALDPINENWITTYDSLFPLFMKYFTPWAVERKLTFNDEAQKQAAFLRFLTERQIAVLEEFTRHLRELGYKGLITDINHYDQIAQIPIRQRLDFADTHIYWNHPDFFADRPWGLPWIQMNRSSVLDRAAIWPRVYFPTRILGKPMMITEFTYCYPNLFRAENGPLMGAYAAWQDWDGLFRFDLGHDFDDLTKDKPAYVFGILHDPINRLADRIIALLFQRNDIRPTKRYVPYVITEDTLYQGYRNGCIHYDDNYRQLGLCVGVGSIDATVRPDFSKKYPVAVGSEALKEQFPGVQIFQPDDKLLDHMKEVGILTPEQCRPDLGQYVSDTGEIRLDSRAKIFTAVTSRSEALVIQDRGKLLGQAVEVDNSGGVCTILVAGLDDQPIRRSRRLLVLHLTDVQNSKTKFRTRDLTVWEKVGELPHLVRRGNATVSINIGRDTNVRVWAIDLSGRKKVEIPCDVNGQTISFVAQTVRQEGTFLAYEIEVDQ